MIHQRLKLRKDGFGGLVITHNCRNLIRTLLALVYDRMNVEDIDAGCEQHATDALRYSLSRRKTEWYVLPVYSI